jgi:DDE superfamily endonuclease
MWVPPEIKDPILQHAPTRKSVACFGAVSLHSGQFVRMMCAIFNAVTFQSFLQRLLRQQTPGRRMMLVLDNARYHHAILLAPSTAGVSTAIQPATGPDRTSLEADPAPRNAQPVLRNASRSAQSRQRLLRPLAPTKQSAASIMLHYLRRCV